MKAFERRLPRVVEWLPPDVVDHYIRPSLVRQPRAPYDARAYFESKYNLIFDHEFSDRVTIWHDFDPRSARHHYNSVENGIIEYFAHVERPHHPRVLDIGSGAGHWIDFFLELFEPSVVVGVEISPRCVAELRRKYAERADVLIVEDDISRAGLSLGRPFDVIVAIGVMFHIVDDAVWERVLAILSRHLAESGTLIVGGHFGLFTRSTQFAPLDEFGSWDEFLDAEADVALVKKRIRSLRYWKRRAHRSGLTLSRVHRTRHHRAIPAPENNLLFLRPARVR